jgi:predicted enzyme related to lactoylglutathione lyase
MPRPIHFEIHASDPERVQEFYRRLFGWQFQTWEGPMEYWLVTTGPDAEPGINGGLLRGQGPAAAEEQGVKAYVCTVGVDSEDSALGTAGELGGIVAVPKMPVPGMGWLAYVKDPDGNIVGMMRMDPSAR